MEALVAAIALVCQIETTVHVNSAEECAVFVANCALTALKEPTQKQVEACAREWIREQSK